MMKSAMTLLGAVVALATLAASIEIAFAQSERCQELWVERNSIYRARGYCFKTERAITYFGNTGCRFDNEADVPLSDNERARINEIRGMERDYGCR